MSSNLGLFAFLFMLKCLEFCVDWELQLKCDTALRRSKHTVLSVFFSPTVAADIKIVPLKKVSRAFTYPQPENSYYSSYCSNYQVNH